MTLLEKINENSILKILEDEYKVLGKTFYVTEKEPDVMYAKILLNNHYVLVISPEDRIIYFGKDVGTIADFSGFNEHVNYDKNLFHQVNHDYQIVVSIEFGSPIKVEGEVEFWDYEYEDNIISVAVNSRTKSRADVIAKYISEDVIEII